MRLRRDLVNRKFTILGMILLFGSVAAAQPPASSGPIAATMAGKRVLLVSAHPDDEGLFAPLMAEACRFNGGTCHMVVAAEAKSPGCGRTIQLEDRDKCSALRRMETRASAANLNATYEFYGWRDAMAPWNDAGLDQNISEWAHEAGGRDKLVGRIARTLQEFKPDFVLGFDPRHGTTCHPGHRAIVLLMLEARDTLPALERPQVWLESDFAVPTTTPPALLPIIESFGIARWPGDKAPATWVDGNFALPDGRTGWDFIVEALRLNATQFPEVATGKLTPSPDPKYRLIPFVNLVDIDPNQRGMCEQYTPGFSRLR